MTAPTPFTSASEIKVYRDECKRLWAFKYVLKVESETGAAAALGIDVDDNQLQPYLLMGRPFDYTTDNGSGYIAAAGLAMLPSPDSPGLEVQKHFVLPSARSRPGEPAPFGYHGYMDCWLPNGGLPDMPQDSHVQVVDFKCTSNPDGFWVKTAETLGDDVQAMLYATWALYSTGARFVDLVWLYFATRGRRRVKRVWRRVDREHVATRFLAIDAVASELVALKLKKPDPLSLPPSPTACDNFGGCPHRATCNLGPGDNADSYAAKHSIKGDTQMDFGQLFSNLQAKAADTVPTAVAPPAPVATGLGVGINPPESNLPPAPAVGTVAAPVAPDAATTVAPAKRTRRTKAEMEAARAAVGATVDGGTGFDEVPEGSTVTTTTINNTTTLAAPIETVTVTWSEERFSPVSYQSFGVGPFTITGAVKPGESTAQAILRLHAELHEAASTLRGSKAASFASILGSFGVGK